MAAGYSIPTGSFATQTALSIEPSNASPAEASDEPNVVVSGLSSKAKPSRHHAKASARSYWIKGTINYSPLPGAKPVLSIQCVAHAYVSGQGVAGGEAEYGMGSSAQTAFSLTDSIETKVLSLHEPSYSFQVRVDLGATEWEAQPRDGLWHGMKAATISIVNLVSDKVTGAFAPSAFKLSIPAARPE